MDMQEGGDFVHGRQCSTDMQEGGAWLAGFRKITILTSLPVLEVLASAICRWAMVNLSLLDNTVHIIIA